MRQFWHQIGFLFGEMLNYYLSHAAMEAWLEVVPTNQIRTILGSPLYIEIEIIQDNCSIGYEYLSARLSARVLNFVKPPGAYCIKQI